MMIRQNIDRYDWVVSKQVPDEQKPIKRTIRGHYGDVSLGSPRKPWSFASLEDNNSADPAFFKFRIALQNLLVVGRCRQIPKRNVTTYVKCKDKIKTVNVELQLQFLMNKETYSINVVSGMAERRPTFHICKILQR